MEAPSTVRATVVGESASTGTGAFEFEASVLAVRGERFHLWVGDRHFLADPEGCVQRGQYLLVTTPTAGLLARVVDVDARDAPEPDRRVKLLAECAWDAGGVVPGRREEFWSRARLERDAGRSGGGGGDDPAVRYVRPTSR